MLSQRRRWWYNIKTTLARHLPNVLKMSDMRLGLLKIQQRTSISDIYVNVINNNSEGGTCVNLPLFGSNPDTSKLFFSDTHNYYSCTMKAVTLASLTNKNTQLSPSHHVNTCSPRPLGGKGGHKLIDIISLSAEDVCFEAPGITVTWMITSVMSFQAETIWSPNDGQALDHNYATSSCRVISRGTDQRSRTSWLTCSYE